MNQIGYWEKSITALKEQGVLEYVMQKNKHKLLLVLSGNPHALVASLFQKT